MAIRYDKEKDKIDSKMKIGLEKDNYVLALKDPNNWELARIIEIVPSNSISFSMKDSPEKNQKYYVTFIGENRRWDRYVTFQEISIVIWLGFSKNSRGKDQAWFKKRRRGKERN